MSDDDNVRIVVKDIEELANRYNVWASLLQFAVICLVIVSISSSLVIGFFLNDISGIYIKYLAATSALSTSLLSGLRMTKKAQDLRNGYRYLKYSIYRYKVTEGYSLDELIKAYRNAENIIGHIEYDESSLPSRIREKSTEIV